MPIITIGELEKVSQSALSVTENVVLVPVLYKRTANDTSTVNLKGELFTTVDSLRKYFTENGNNHKVIVEGSIDRSYTFAHDLILAGLPVVVKPITFNEALLNSAGELVEEDVYRILNAALSVAGASGYTPMKEAYKEFESRNTFNIKFITTGGYANRGVFASHIEYDSEEQPFTVYEIATTHSVISSLAEKRTDAVGLIEYTDMFKDEYELLDVLKEEVGASQEKKCACFAPWYTSITFTDDVQKARLMPACFGYLKAFANSVRTNANWFAASGVSRGEIPDFKSAKFNIGDATMHILQGDKGVSGASDYLSVRVNPIYNAGVYGYRIWGNRVFSRDDGSAITKKKYSEFLNVRLLVCDINKQIYYAANRCTFEPNDDIVWLNFKSLVNTLLEQMRTGRGLKNYRWKKEVADDKATIMATLNIKPIEAVEDFDLTIYLTDEEVEVDEEVQTI